LPAGPLFEKKPKTMSTDNTKAKSQPSEREEPPLPEPPPGVADGPKGASPRNPDPPPVQPPARQQSKAVAKQRSSPAQDFIAQILTTDQQGALATLTPAGIGAINPKRFIGGFLTIARNNPAVLDCSPASILESLKLAALSGLVPGEGKAYLIPYKGECTYSIGAWGMVELMRRSGKVSDIRDSIVCAGDEFEIDADGLVRHIKRPFAADRGKIVGVVASALIEGDQTPIVETLDLEQIEAIKGMSKAPGSIAWTKFYDEHIRAKCLRRLAKRVPMDPSAEEAIRSADAAEFLTNAAGAAAARQIMEPRANDE